MAHFYDKNGKWSQHLNPNFPSIGSPLCNPDIVLDAIDTGNNFSDNGNGNDTQK